MAYPHKGVRVLYFDKKLDEIHEAGELICKVPCPPELYPETPTPSILPENTPTPTITPVVDATPSPTSTPNDVSNLCKSISFSNWISFDKATIEFPESGTTSEPTIVFNNWKMNPLNAPDCTFENTTGIQMHLVKRAHSEKIVECAPFNACSLENIWGHAESLASADEGTSLFDIAGVYNLFDFRNWFKANIKGNDLSIFKKWETPANVTFNNWYNDDSELDIIFFSYILDSEFMPVQVLYERVPLIKKSADANAKTTTSSTSNKGDTKILVKNGSKFKTGDDVAIGTGSNREKNKIKGFGSLILETPLLNNYNMDTAVEVVAPPALKFRWQTINGKQTLQVLNLLKPTHTNFSGRVTQETWSTLYAFNGNDNLYSLDNNTWPDAAITERYTEYYGNSFVFDGLKIEFKSSVEDNTSKIKYCQLQITLNEEVEFSDNSNLFTSEPLFVYVGDNNNPNFSASGKSSSWPVILKKETENTPSPTTTYANYVGSQMQLNNLHSDLCKSHKSSKKDLLYTNLKIDKSKMNKCRKMVRDYLPGERKN